MPVSTSAPTGWASPLSSYPCLQLRKLVSLLHDRQLVAMPLDRLAVQVLIRQLLYHLGDLERLEEGGEPRLAWRGDADPSAGGGALEALCLELVSLADELEQKPQSHCMLPALVEIATYFAGWEASFRDVARRYALILCGRADAIAAELQLGSCRTPEETNTLYSSQVHVVWTALQNRFAISLTILYFQFHW